MPGILDLYGDPANQGMLNLSAGLLQAAGPSLMPVSFGQALGRGVQAGAAGYQNALKAKQAQQLVDLESAKADLTRQQLAQAQRQFALQQSLLERFGLTGGQPSASGAVAGSSAPAPISPVITNPGANPRVAPSASATPSQAAPTQFPFDPSQIAALHLAGLPDLTGAYNAAQPNIDLRNGVMFDKKSGAIVGTVPQTNQQGFSTITVPDKSSPTGFRVEVVPGALPAYMAQQRAGEKAKAERDLVAVPATAPNQPPTYKSREQLLGGEVPAGMSPAATAAQAADAAQQAEVSKNYGKMFNDLQNSAMSNPAKIAKFQKIGALLGDFEGGKLSKLGFDIARVGNSAGLKIDPRLPNKEAAEALANEAALDMRSTASGGGMPGAMSDADREFLKNITPNMSQTAEGRKTIIESRVKLMQRENQVADMARQYRKKYGKLDDDFFSQLQDWSNRNPLFAK